MSFKLRIEKWHKTIKLRKIAIYKDFDILFTVYKIVIVTLAGITISTLNGNGLLKKAEDAKQKTENV